MTRASAKLSRRGFLQQVAIVGGGIALADCHRRKPPHVPGRVGRALNAREWALCAAASERIFPADADPGAIQLGVVDYIDARLAQRGRRVARGRRRFRRGLALLAKWSQDRHGQDFLDLSPDDQDVALASLAAEGGPHAYAFVRRLMVLTLEGVFADPAYGGNRGGAGWKIIGFDAPCPNPRCH